MIPNYIESAVAEFGRSAGLASFAFSERGAAALKFSFGATLRFEYAMDKLMVAMTMPCGNDEGTMRKILGYSKPPARGAQCVRAGYLAKRAEAIFAVAIPERDVTPPAINVAFATLWQIITEFGGPQ